MSEAATSIDITKPGYMIELKKLDPVGRSHASDPSKYSGKLAATFLLGKLASMLLFIIPIIAGIAFIVAGYYYILSGGDSEKASQAKTIIKWNLIAIIVALFSYSLIYVIASLLSGSL